MQNLRNVLLLGGSSFIGRAVAARLPGRTTVTYHRRAVPGGLKFDAAVDDLAQVVRDPAPFSHAVVLLGDTKLNSCHADPARSHALNVAGICRAIEQLQAWQIVPVFTSTEAVYDGVRGNYDETDRPNPLVVYGKQKVEVEEFLAARVPQHLLLRLAMVYGDVPGDGTLLTDWAAKLKRGEPLTCAHDNRSAPIHVDDCAAMIVELLARGCTGTYHLAGPRSVSRCDLVDLLADEAVLAGAPPPSIRRCSIDDFTLPEPRPHDVSLNSTKARLATGIEPRDVATACREIIRRTFAS